MLAVVKTAQCSIALANVQVSDTTGDDSSNAAELIKHRM
jgi:hypothetical protein